MGLTGASSRMKMLQYLHQYCFLEIQYLSKSALCAQLGIPLTQSCCQNEDESKMVDFGEFNKLGGGDSGGRQHLSPLSLTESKSRLAW